jgi:hypothetical protein
MEVVTTANIAKGIEIKRSTKGAMAYSGFHMLKSVLSEPLPTNMADEGDCGDVVTSEEGRHVKVCGDA